MNCPFTGSPCSEKPVVFITDIANGEIKTHEMCSQCGAKYMHELQTTIARKINKKLPTSQQLFQVVNSVEQLLGMLSGKKAVSKAACPQCKLTIREFNKTGRFGCPNCYDHFSKEFDSLAVTLHDIRADQPIQHTGKRPKSMHKSASLEDQVKLLKLKMAYAIEHEKYEEAATLKQQIRNMTGD